MRVNHLFSKFSRVSIPIILNLLVASCSRQQSPSISSPSPVSEIPDTPEQKVTLNDSDLSNVDKLLLQVNRAGQQNKKISSGLLETGIRLTEEDRKQGLHGERDGLAKMFCGSAVGYPTVQALIGCAESLVIADASFDVKVKRMKDASKIYRATLEFAKRTNYSLPATERQRILDNIKCLDNFVQAPNPNAPSCELIKISLTKAPGIVKQNKTGVAY